MAHASPPLAAAIAVTNCNLPEEASQGQQDSAVLNPQEMAEMLREGEGRLGGRWVRRGVADSCCGRLGRRGAPFPVSFLLSLSVLSSAARLMVTHKVIGWFSIMIIVLLRISELFTTPIW